MATIHTRSCRLIRGYIEAMRMQMNYVGDGGLRRGNAAAISKDDGGNRFK